MEHEELIDCHKCGYTHREGYNCAAVSASGSNDLLYAVNALDVSLRPNGPIERAVFNGLNGGNDSAPAVAIQRCQKHIETIKKELGI